MKSKYEKHEMDKIVFCIDHYSITFKFSKRKINL